MAAALVVPISGPYTATFNAFPMGVQNDDGYELEATLQGQEVRESDQYGMTLVEAIYRGQNWKCRFRGLEWNKTGLLSILQMFGQIGLNSTLTPDLSFIGDRWSHWCEALVLTAILGNPPTYPQTLTALNSGFSPNSTSAFGMTSKVREFPIEMILLPYSTTISGVSYNVPFTSA